MTRILAVLGTRPEVIKMAPVLDALRDDPTVTVTVCVTGQHRRLLDGALEFFGIAPAYDLDVMASQRSLTAVTRAILGGMERVIARERPDWVLVQGDTTTVMAASLAAFYQRRRVAHIEAGLRTFDVHAPFPEEVNRRVAGMIADLHFAPTPAAAANLHREGVPSDRIYVTGNTVIDALQRVSATPFDPRGTPLGEVPLERDLVLVTAHRRENWGTPMREIALGLRDLALRHPEVQLVYPLHVSPEGRRHAKDQLTDLANVSLVEPLDYRSLLWLLARCRLVITDSGGIQEEAAAIGRPTLVLRSATERLEGVESGAARLVGADRRRLLLHASRLLAGTPLPPKATCAYGDGCAGMRIARLLGGRATSAPDQRDRDAAPTVAW